MKSRLDGMIRAHGPKHWSFAARKDKAFLEWVDEQTRDLPQTTPFAVRIYAAVSGTRPTCERGGVRSLKSVTDGWRYCGRAATCACAAEAVSRSCKSAWASISDERRAEINESRSQTLRGRYGVENAGRLPSAVAAHEAFYADPENVQRAVAKGRATMLAAYGVDNALKLPEVAAIRPTIASSLTEEAKRSRALKRRALMEQGAYLDASYERLRSVFAALGFTLLSTRDEYSGVGGKGNRIQYAFRCDRCGTEFCNRIYDGARPRCEVCEPRTPSYVSSEENEVASFIENLGFEVRRTVRKRIPGVELDILVPSLNIAIEYCGLYWHSEWSQGKDRNQHLRKHEMCLEEGIRLITIFSDEWISQRTVCEHRLRAILGVETQRVYARKTQLVTLGNAEAGAFLDAFHIQGRANGAAHAFGLLKDGEIVSVMTFGRPRRSNNHEQRDGVWELYRFASSCSVPGGASRLFTAFLRQEDPDEVISFCDRRWGTGTVYEKMGFSLSGKSAPGYAWVEKYMMRHYRYKFAKHILVAQGHDPALSEVQIMKSLGYDRIWDCGTLKFIWRKTV